MPPINAAFFTSLSYLLVENELLLLEYHPVISIIRSLWAVISNIRNKTEVQLVDHLTAIDLVSLIATKSFHTNEPVLSILGKQL